MMGLVSRRELAYRRKEARARAMIHVANRTWQQNPSRLNALVSRIVGRVATSRMPAREDPDDLYLE